MAEESRFEFAQRRDGTSQAQRPRAALDPDYVHVDERSFQDLLAFAQAYARELRYQDSAGGASGTRDWSAFLPPDLQLDEVVAFMRDPERLTPQQARRFQRPHVVLFLTFLHLLRHAQDHLNTLTRRHLDFDYQEVLRMTKKPGTPDHLHVLVELADDAEPFLLPAGTHLDAGADALGQALVYQTDRDLVVNRAQVARVSSLYVDREITGIRDAWKASDGENRAKIILMFQIALGEPLPGDTLPLYPDVDEADHSSLIERTKIDYNILESLRKQVDFVVAKSGLGLTFADFKHLVQLKQRRDEQDASDWEKINRLLTQAAQGQIPPREFSPKDESKRAFEANLKEALAPEFAGIRLVNQFDDLHELRSRAEVKTFIEDELGFKLGRPKQPIGLAHFLDLRVRAQNPAILGIPM